MLVKQISVFVENKSGRLLEMLKTLGENNIDLSALSVADTTEFGIARMIVCDAEKAKKVLKDHGVIVKITDVVIISVPDEPGALIKALEVLNENKIAIEYMYAFSEKIDNNSLIVLRCDDVVKAVEALNDAGVKLVSQNEIK